MPHLCLDRDAVPQQKEAGFGGRHDLAISQDAEIRDVREVDAAKLANVALQRNRVHRGTHIFVRTRVLVAA
jgi:hypothetical protein